MILNLAPLRSYHLDTLSSLNVSSRAKRIEVREIENEIVYKQPPRSTTNSGSNITRQPLRPLANAHNINAGAAAAAAGKPADRQSRRLVSTLTRPNRLLSRDRRIQLSNDPPNHINAPRIPMVEADPPR